MAKPQNNIIGHHDNDDNNSELVPLLEMPDNCNGDAVASLGVGSHDGVGGAHGDEAKNEGRKNNANGVRLISLLFSPSQSPLLSSSYRRGYEMKKEPCGSRQSLWYVST